jgi:aminocarboxymuconate-semialdehyde decarboxylase
MDQQGIDAQVVGGWVDMFGYELPSQEGEAWSRLINNALLAAAKAEPRFVPLAAVPLQDGQRAAAVLKAAMDAGLPGTMIGTLPRGVGSVLDDADLDPFWAAADALVPWARSSISTRASMPAMPGSTISASPMQSAGSPTPWWRWRG